MELVKCEPTRETEIMSLATYRAHLLIKWGGKKVGYTSLAEKNVHKQYYVRGLNVRTSCLLSPVRNIYHTVISTYIYTLDID